VSEIFGGVTRTVGTAVGAGVGNIDDLARGDTQQILDKLRQPETAHTVAAATGMPESEVRAEFAQLEQRVQQAQNDPARVAAEVREATSRMIDRARAQLPEQAERMKPGATKTAWITFIAMVLSLAASMGGAMLGRRRALARVEEAVAGDLGR
jgi:hypothetical protein